MPLYVDDYDAATAHLSVEEDGTYMRLLRLCWRTPRCSIPDDAEWIMRRMRVDRAAYDRLVEPIISEFFKRVRGRISQKRLLQEFESVHELKAKRSRAGKKGASAKALKENGFDASKASANAQQNESKAEASIPIPITIPIEEREGAKAPSCQPALPRLADLPDDAKIAFDRWQQLRSRIRPKTRPLTFTSQRRGKLTKRLKEIGGLDAWDRCLASVEGSPLLRGDTTNWSAEIDWMLEPKNLTKVIEGNYDHDEQHNQLAVVSGRPSSGPRSPVDAVSRALDRLGTGGS